MLQAQYTSETWPYVTSRNDNEIPKRDPQSMRGTVPEGRNRSSSFKKHDEFESTALRCYVKGQTAHALMPGKLDKNASTNFGA